MYCSPVQYSLARWGAEPGPSWTAGPVVLDYDTELSVLLVVVEVRYYLKLYSSDRRFSLKGPQICLLRTTCDLGRITLMTNTY